MTSPHLPPDDPRREREFRHDDEFVDPRQRSEMPFLDHLEELRSVLLHAVLAVLAGGVFGWWLAPRVLQDLIARTVGQASVLSPFEAFNERFKLAIVIGGFLALPVVLWRVWSFVVPGLLRRERHLVPVLVLCSFTLFGVGAAAAYGYLIPLVLQVLDRFLLPGMVEQIRLSALLDFVYNLCIACGTLMQLPLVTMLLTFLGIVTPLFLLQQWRVAVVVIFIVTALITPGDLVTAQIIMGGPMVALYFISVGLSFLVARRRAREEAEVLGPIEGGPGGDST